MAYLLHTHLVLWAAYEPERLSTKARRLLESRKETIAFSLATIWEVAIKTSLGRADFAVDPLALLQGLGRLDALDGGRGPRGLREVRQGGVSGGPVPAGAAACGGARRRNRTPASPHFGASRMAPSRRIVSPLSMSFSTMCTASLP